MDFLKAEIERKRKELDQANVLNSQKKYFKRGELEQQQTELFWKKKNEKDKEKEQTDLNHEKSSSHHSAKHDKLKNLIKDDEEKKVLPRNEVIKRLRERGQPIRLFGESDLDAAKRLNMIETSEPEENGMRNDFKLAMDKSEQESLNELMNSVNGEKGDANSAQDVEIKEDDTINFNEILELSKNRNKANDMLMVLKYIKFIVKKWGQALNSRTIDEKLTTKGRIETALHSQTVSYLKPLCRKLKTSSLPDDILDSLVKIFLELIDRNYIKANEHFLEMAIGNAPWPIGATMVGIHARPGRERISSKKIAHVLNDEVQRKYIQAVKRLISKCQQYFPTDPSRCVEYGLSLIHI